jgi:hypothetical protein
MITSRSQVCFAKISSSGFQEGTLHGNCPKSSQLRGARVMYWLVRAEDLSWFAFILLRKLFGRLSPRTT